MKKAMKISGIILGIILIIALVIFIFCPGIFTYIKVKHKYKNIDRTIGKFETVDIPDTFKSYDLNGISLKAPDDYKKTKTSHGLRSPDEKITIMILQWDMAETEALLNEYGHDVDQWEHYEYEESDYRSFFKAVDDKYPVNYDASSDILWFIKDRLNAEMCLKLRSKDRKVFLEFADIKENAWAIENAWKMSGDGFTAYVSEDISDMYSDSFWAVTIYPDSGGSEHYFAVIKGAGEETSKQIISSMRISE